MKMLCVAALATAAWAGPITYGLDARSPGLTFAGSFTVNDGALVGLDILGGGAEWTMANSFSARVSPQSLGVSTCTPVGVNCYGALAKIYTLWMTWDQGGAAHGVFDVTFPGDSAEFQYTVTGSVGAVVPVQAAAVHNPEPGTWGMLVVGVMIMTRMRPVRGR